MSSEPEGITGIAGVDVSVPNAARMHDYYLGGSNNFEADRTAAEEVLRFVPAIRPAAIENRRFLGVAVRWLAGQGGITQFLDIGTGLPANGAVHEIAAAVSPAARVVYADYDPTVIAHGNALLSGTDSAIAVGGDLRQPADLLADPEVAEHLDLSQPVAVFLLAILHFIADDYIPGIIAALRDALAPGSYVIISHVGGYKSRRASDGDDEALRIYARARQPVFPRAEAEFTRLLDGFELLDPAILAAGSPASERDAATGEGIIGWRLVARRL